LDCDRLRAASRGRSSSPKVTTTDEGCAYVRRRPLIVVAPATKPCGFVIVSHKNAAGQTKFPEAAFPCALFFAFRANAMVPRCEARMNIQLPVQMDKPEFLAWVERQEARYELSEGRVVMMVGASAAHGLIVGNLIAILKGQVDPKEWWVIPDHGLDLGPKTLRYPDIVIERAGGDRKRRTATAPILLAEVLSPSAADVDLGDKAAEYLQLSTLATYLVFSQDEPKAWMWTRREQGFPPAPIVVKGEDKIIQVPALRLMLPMGATYAGVFAA